VALAGSSKVVVRKGEEVGAPTMIGPDLFPEGWTVLVYPLEPAKSGDVVTTKCEGIGEPITIVLGLFPDG
jgi:hypothetical protein